MRESSSSTNRSPCTGSPIGKRVRIGLSSCRRSSVLNSSCRRVAVRKQHRQAVEDRDTPHCARGARKHARLRRESRSPGRRIVLARAPSVPHGMRHRSTSVVRSSNRPMVQSFRAHSGQRSRLVESLPHRVGVPADLRPSDAPVRSEWRRRTRRRSAPRCAFHVRSLSTKPPRPARGCGPTLPRSRKQPSIELRSARASPAGNRKPVSPSRISSRWPPTSDATNMRPCAIASSGFSGVTSSRQADAQTRIGEHVDELVVAAAPRRAAPGRRR